jgi:1-acyl-sn-glycerol-3-phosphate acyltransferase
MVHAFACAWGYHYIQLVPVWNCAFEGVDYIDSKKTYVLVANHQSFMDILVLYGLFKPYKWVSKESIFKVPFIGLNMRLNQYVEIKRGNLSSIKAMMRTCHEWITRQASVLIFPEGTRSPDGNLQSFKDGAFRLAIDCGVEVIPIVVDGTSNIMPKTSKYLSFDKRNIRVKVLAPVSGSKFDNNSHQMRDYVHDLMAKTLDQMRNQSVALETAKG